MQDVDHKSQDVKKTEESNNVHDKEKGKENENENER